MKVLSMIQPWASLFILGESQFETRTWRTHYRGPIAIHTSKKLDKQALAHPNMKLLLQKHGYTIENLPTGLIIGTCNLVNCLKVARNHQTWAQLEDGRMVSGNDYFLGDFREGNYAWEVSDRKLLDHFLQASGKLGLWEYNF
jgi:activating signal cointegrator 1